MYVYSNTLYFCAGIWTRANGHEHQFVTIRKHAFIALPFPFSLPLYLFSELIALFLFMAAGKNDRVAL